MQLGIARSPGWALLKSGNFRYLWLGQIVSQIGDGLSKVALLWFVYELTGSAWEMTLVGVLQSLPPLLMSPFLGVYIDRLRKKSILISVDLIRVVLITLIPILYYFGVLTLPWIYILVFANAVVAAVFGPTMAATIPLLVKSSDLMAANGLIHNASTVGVLAGPAIGGILSALIGAHNVLFVDALTFAFSAACLALIKYVEPRQANRRRITDGINKELRESVRFVFFHSPAIRGILITSALFTGGVAAFPLLLPIFAKVYLNVGSVWLGWIWSALGVGMALMTLVLAWIRQKSQRTKFLIMCVGTGVAAVTVVGLTFVPGPWAATGLVGIVGAGIAIFTPLMWTLLQERTPDRLRGRVFALVGATDMAAASSMMACMGWIADQFGPVASLRGVSLLFLATAIIIWWIQRREYSVESTDIRAHAVYGSSP